MSARTPLLATLFLAATTMAQQQSSVLSLPFYGYDTQPVVASVLAANPSATTLSLACRPGTDASDCGLFPVQLLTVGPSTYHMSMGAGDSFTGTQDCVTMGTTGAVCSESAGGQGANFPGMSVTTYEGTDVEVLAVTVTAGAGKLGGGGASSSGPASASASATSSGEITVLTGTATSTASSASVSGSGSSSGTGSATGSAAAETSSSAAVANMKGRAGVSSFIVAAMSLLGFWLW